MILPIVYYGQPVLRVKCPLVPLPDDSLENLAKDMLETMEDANGIGLAAPQIGKELNMAVIDLSGDKDAASYVYLDGKEVDIDAVMPLVFCNPVLTLSGERERENEGCLSIPGIQAGVMRPVEVKMEYQGIDGKEHVLEADGLLGRAIQHETDHLNGILFVDRISPAAKIGVRKKLKNLFP